MTERNEITPQKTNAGSQRLVLFDRQSLELTGIEDVVSFDEAGAVLSTSLGMLAVDGEDLHVVKLDLAGGSIQIEGKVNGLFFSAGKGGKGRRGAKKLGC